MENMTTLLLSLSAVFAVLAFVSLFKVHYFKPRDNSKNWDRIDFVISLLIVLLFFGMVFMLIAINMNHENDLLPLFFMCMSLEQLALHLWLRHLIGWTNFEYDKDAEAPKKYRLGLLNGIGNCVIGKRYYTRSNPDCKVIYIVLTIFFIPVYCLDCMEITDEATLPATSLRTISKKEYRFKSLQEIRFLEMADVYSSRWWIVYALLGIIEAVILLFQ